MDEISTFHEQFPIFLGKNGKLVQIDECMVGGIRKYNKGRYGQVQIWVFGAIDYETKKIVLIHVGDRQSETLIPLIKMHIKDGSKIHSDCYKSYNSLKSENFEHDTVDHTKFFMNQNTNTNTQMKVFGPK